MKITLKLFATFRVDRFKEEERDYPEGSTCREVLASVGIREWELGILLVNGRHAPPEQELSEGDVVSLFPLIGGG